MENLQEDKGFKVDDLSTANWALRKLAEIQRKEKEIELLASEEVHRIKEWESKEKKSLKNNKDYFSSLLERYYREQKAIDPKFRITTPYGQVSSRKQQPEFKIEDEKLLNWVKNNKPEFVKVVESTDWAELKKNIKVSKDMAITEQGEIVEGVTVIEREDNIVIKVVD